MRHFPPQFPQQGLGGSPSTLPSPYPVVEAGGGQNCRGHSGTSLPCSHRVTVQSTWKTPHVGLLASFPGFFFRIYHPRGPATVSHLCSTWLSPPWQDRAFPEVFEHFCKREFHLNKEARIWRKMNGKAVTRANSCHHAANAAFQYETESSI